ncbi:MAG TPA: DcaP family trimeric outer membrane transporter [Blastocatellia bacterium]|nr:DcaP family trimeric outer membrane transporter [Blastocatellia bacterium]
MESKSGARCTRAIRSALVGIAFLVIAAPVALAQETDKASTEVQQLKEKLQKLEQTVHELKTQLSAMQQPRIAPAANTPSSSAVPPSDKTTVTETTAVATKPTVPSRSTQENEKKGENTFQVYGFAMLDFGYQFKQNDPDWFDVIRPTKLPASKDQFAPDGKTYFGVRQSRLGVKSTTATPLGELKTQFEFELFGTGVDAGQTTFRLRHAYGELGHFGGGQTWSPFMDIDVFPNSIEYWGPNGMVFFRNVQARWMPLKGKNEVTIAIERPGASGDQGRFADRVKLLEGIQPKFDLPDFSGHVRFNRDWGHVQFAGIVRRIRWVDTNHDRFDLSDSVVGWGATVSSNLKFNKNNIGRFQFVYGAGIENYMNDAPVDVGIKRGADPATPIKGEALPVLGVVSFLDHTWSKRFSSSIGYSLVNIENSEGQEDNAYHRGHYGLANLLFYPYDNVMLGGEFQWGRRENFRDGFASNDYRIQFSFRYNFSKLFSF